MDKSLEDRCRTFAAMALGRSPRADELTALLRDAGSLSEFRILLVSRPEYEGQFATVLDKWRAALPKAAKPSRSIGSLTHDIEQMSHRLQSFEEKLELQSDNIMQAMHRLDQLIDGYRGASKEAQDMRETIQSYRARLIEIAMRSQAVASPAATATPAATPAAKKVVS